jgi:hypothetical protein
MATLGDVLAAARSSAGSFQSSLEASDPELAVSVSRAASREGMSPAAFVRCAIADFARFASEEHWATVVSAIRDSSDPGAECMRAMVNWRLTVKGCGEHSFATHAAGVHHDRHPSR